jgi:hypothetical protein
MQFDFIRTNFGLLFSNRPLPLFRNLGNLPYVQFSVYWNLYNPVVDTESLNVFRLSLSTEKEHSKASFFVH